MTRKKTSGVADGMSTSKAMLKKNPSKAESDLSRPKLIVASARCMSYQDFWIAKGYIQLSPVQATGFQRCRALLHDPITSSPDLVHEAFPSPIVKSPRQGKNFQWVTAHLGLCPSCIKRPVRFTGVHEQFATPALLPPRRFLFAIAAEIVVNGFARVLIVPQITSKPIGYVWNLIVEEWSTRRRGRCAAMAFILINGKAARLLICSVLGVVAIHQASSTSPISVTRRVDCWDPRRSTLCLEVARMHHTRSLQPIFDACITIRGCCNCRSTSHRMPKDPTRMGVINIGPM